MTGLDAAGQYTVRDLYRFRTTSRNDDGQIQGALEPTGQAPTFADEIVAYGLASPHVNGTPAQV